MPLILLRAGRRATPRCSSGALARDRRRGRRRGEGVARGGRLGAVLLLAAAAAAARARGLRRHALVAAARRRASGSPTRSSGSAALVAAAIAAASFDLARRPRRRLARANRATDWACSSARQHRRRRSSSHRSCARGSSGARPASHGCRSGWRSSLRRSRVSLARRHRRRSARPGRRLSRRSRSSSGRRCAPAAWASAPSSSISALIAAGEHDRRTRPVRRRADTRRAARSSLNSFLIVLGLTGLLLVGLEEARPQSATGLSEAEERHRSISTGCRSSPTSGASSLSTAAALPEQADRGAPRLSDGALALRAALRVGARPSGRPRDQRRAERAQPRRGRRAGRVPDDPRGRPVVWVLDHMAARARRGRQGVAQQGFVVDISERKALEEQLRQAQKTRGARPARRRHRARLQQPPHRDLRLHRTRARARRRDERPLRRDLARDRTRAATGSGAHAPAARVQPPAGAQRAASSTSTTS